MSIKISVIVPCYNVQKELLMRCVKSILTQSFTDYEVVLVNDGSSEEFIPFLDEAEKLDERIRLVTQKNQGVSAARNNGVSVSQGEYIIFVDADDMLLPYFFDEAVKLITNTGVDFVIGGNAELDPYLDSEKNTDKSDTFKTKIFCGEAKAKLKSHLLGRLLGFGNEGGYIGRGPWTRILKREFAENTPFDTSLPIGEDILWNLQLVEKCEKICVAYRIWYLYYVNNASATHKFNNNVVYISEKQLAAFKEHIDFNSDVQYCAYCERILEELQRINDYYLSSDKCPLDKKKKKQLIHKLYTAPLWKPAGDPRFYKKTTKNRKLKALLYRYKLLFLFFKIKSFERK